MTIDRAFVQEIVENADDQASAPTILQLARTLRLSTVAEGIKTLEQLERLRALGRDHAQSFYVVRPIPSEQSSALLARGHDVDIRSVA